MKLATLTLVALLIIFYFFSSISGSNGDRPPPGTPEVVVVTTFEQAFADKVNYVRKIKENRIEYAKRHG